MIKEDQLRITDPFLAEVQSRFGVLPNFFCTASSAPGLIEELWGFARSAYLDSPLPSLFKERLFVHLSRFCEIRYCVIRHVGFLVGKGRPAGDSNAVPESIAQAIVLLSRPVPRADQLDRSIELLESLPEPVAIPAAESELEWALFDALTILFIRPRDAERARFALARTLGDATFEVVVAFLAFVRTAHYWTETHPTLKCEQDMIELMRRQPALAKLMQDTSEAEWANSGQALRRALDELRMASGALRSNETRFRALLLAVSNMVFSMNPDWSEMRSLDGRGFLPDTKSADPNWMSRYIPEDERGRLAAAIERAVVARDVFELEHRVIRQDGSVGWVLSRAVPLFADNGDLLEWFGAAIDLTARKNAEDALRDADRRKDHFLATLAHELRNPLAPIRNGLLIAHLDAQPGTRLARTLEIMDRQFNMLVHLVDDLMDISRIASGKIQLRYQSIALNDVLAAGVETVHALVTARGHHLIFEPSSEDIRVTGDFDRLTQVFLNLLRNAAKYTEKGGTIQLRMDRDRNDAVVSVTDTGVGLSEEDLPGVFDMFWQGDSQREHIDGGLGIGLSLVKQLAEMHGGSVHAASPGLGQGTTFTVRLPLTNS